ncbi:hypothetical protein K2173_008276 [Erythroxylum novogranatense]|uniref:Uncharacterized protein n=1 Tax=Erythroxylum novogranatense TaxID=1862640 RepID=A0AAV8U659_9ROSI|nr:hypothetical protein K2173_008276 [Erythroxylum novogranatense]
MASLSSPLPLTKPETTSLFFKGRKSRIGVASHPPSHYSKSPVHSLRFPHSSPKFTAVKSSRFFVRSFSNDFSTDNQSDVKQNTPNAADYEPLVKNRADVIAFSKK